MGDHDAQSHAAVRGKRQPHRRVAVQVDVAGHRCGDFRAGGRGLLRRLAAALTAALALAPRLLAGQIALMKGDLTFGVDVDIDPPAFALGGHFMLPCLEIDTGRDDLDRAPPVFEIGGLAPLDLGGLRGPELVGIGEIAFIAEKVFDDLAVEGGKIEQRRAGRNRRAAEQPCFQLLAARCIAIGILEQRQPSLLLGLGGKGQVLDRGRVDFLGAEGIADTRQQIAECKDALHLQLCEREGCGNVLDIAAFLDQPRVAFPLGDRIGVLAKHVLDHRDFERVGIVTLADHDARQGQFVLALLRGLKAGVIAPLARNDLEMTF